MVSRTPGGTRGRIGRALVLAACTAAFTAAQGPSPDQRPMVIGIVEVPALFGRLSPDGRLVRPAGAGPLLLRRAPSAGSPVAAVISSPDLVESAEYAYEEAGALVVGRAGDWSLLRTRAGTSGWLAPGDSGGFHAIEDLLRDGLTYLTASSEAALSELPGGPGVPLPPDRRRVIVGYLEPRLVQTEVTLRPGEDPDAVRDRLRASASRLTTRADGTRMLRLETGTVHPLVERPDATARMVAQVETNRSGDTLAAAAGVPAQVPVFDLQPGWFQVALRRERWQEAPRAWLEASAAWRFVPVTDPADAARVLSRAWPESPRSVRVLGFTRAGNRLWADVELLSDSPCESAEPAVVARGWMPLHTPAGDTAIWFWSRGC